MYITLNYMRTIWSHVLSTSLAQQKRLFAITYRYLKEAEVKWLYTEYCIHCAFSPLLLATINKFTHTQEVSAVTSLQQIHAWRKTFCNKSGCRTFKYICAFGYSTLQFLQKITTEKKQILHTGKYTYI